MKNSTIKITSLEALSGFAKKVAKKLKGGEVLLLSGELGAGKTTFVKELVKALGSDEMVTSPTFVLRNEYALPAATFFHIDLYRLENGKAEHFEFLERVGDKDTITCIEWPVRINDIKNITGKIIELTFIITDEVTRLIKYS